MNPAVLSVGVYDGVHRGHVELLRRARFRADRAGAGLVVFTFDPHPAAVLGEGAPPVLTPSATRLSLLREAGANEIRTLRFSASLAGKPPERFLVDHVFPFHRMAGIVVGYDFAMGRDRRGTGEALRALGARWGFFVERVPPLEAGEAPVSSTRVRERLAAGDVEGAGLLLGRRFSLAGTVGSGRGLGRDLGFPTANLRLGPGLARPARGVYAVWAELDGVRHPAVANIGTRPTVGGETETVEAHLLGFSGELVDRRLVLHFVRRLRSEIKFNSLNELKDQIREDAGRAAATLAAATD